MKKLVCLLTPIFIGIFTCALLNSYLNKQIQVMLETKDISQINNEYGSTYKDKGVVFNNYVDSKDSVILQATSELNAPVSEVPSKFFPIKGMERVTSMGNQGAQSISQLTTLGSYGKHNKNRKIALVVSLQWFYGKKGIGGDAFQANFGPVQFYNFMNNENISKENKRKYAARASKLLRGSTQYYPEKAYAQFYSSDNIIMKAAGLVFEPYFFVREKMVTLKDKGLLYKRLSKLPAKDSTSQESPRTVKWHDEYAKAEEEGKQAITNNDFCVSDSYYDRVKDKMGKDKDSMKDTPLIVSREFDDLKLYFDTCDDLGIKPYIIIMPTNGKWYDYLGLKKDKRDEFYDKVEKLAKDHNFDVLNLKNEEYTPYFMVDGVHFGWKGWLKVDEELYKHFKTR